MRHRLPILWTFLGVFNLKEIVFVMGVLGGLITSKIVNKFEIKQQGELDAHLANKGLYVVLDPAVNFNALGPTRIILCLTKGFRQEHLL